MKSLFTQEDIISQIEIKKSELNGLDPIEPYAIDRIINSILNLISDLIAVTPIDKLTENGKAKVVDFYEDALNKLLHTKNKEVGYVHDYYKLMMKRKAAKKREQEVDDAFRKLVSRVSSDTFIIGKI